MKDIMRKKKCGGKIAFLEIPQRNQSDIVYIMTTQLPDLMLKALFSHLKSVMSSF